MLLPDEATMRRQQERPIQKSDVKCILQVFFKDLDTPCRLCYMRTGFGAHLLLNVSYPAAIVDSEGAVREGGNALDIELCIKCYEKMFNRLQREQVLPSYSALRARYVGDVRWMSFDRPVVKIASLISEGIGEIQKELRRAGAQGWGMDHSPSFHV